MSTTRFTDDMRMEEMRRCNTLAGAQRRVEYARSQCDTELKEREIALALKHFMIGSHAHRSPWR